MDILKKNAWNHFLLKKLKLKPREKKTNKSKTLISLTEKRKKNTWEGKRKLYQEISHPYKSLERSSVQ